MSSISANGLSQAIYLQMSGSAMQYSIGSLTLPGTYTSITSWPVTINNSNPGASSILKVVATQALTISSSTGSTSGYFISGTTYLTFDGSGYTITINTITSYPGFIQNGTSGANGKANIVVQNFTTAISGGSTLPNGSGWLCQSYFGKSALGNSITSCTNNALINGIGSGGIAGESVGSGTGSSVTFTSCINNGLWAAGAYNAGGIAARGAGTNSGLATFISCTNNANSGQDSTGGICGYNAGTGGGTAVITSCTNNGSTTGSYAGGLAGYGCGTITFTDCTNTGTIGTTRGGGMCGFAPSLPTCTNCVNTGAITGSESGGMIGISAGGSGGTATCTNCVNTGVISGAYSGGILASDAAKNNGTAIIINCYNTGVISGDQAGGIAGKSFGNNTTKNCIIRSCYSTGDISGNLAGGICGANVGYNNGTGPPIIDISNCYSLGAIRTTTGGICGGWDTSVYSATTTLRISNCYSYGALSGTGGGLVGSTLPSANITITTPNTYVAAGTWSDASANAVPLLGLPSGTGISNKGTTWTSISANSPYLLSSFWLLTNPTQIYTPNNVSTGSKAYTSVAGAYSPGIYSILSSSQSGETITTNVAAVAGTSPKYYGYYNNIYTLTNLNGNVRDAISVSINSSSGVMNFDLPDPPCFLEGTQILCFENNEEVYRPIESLRKGDLVKTIYNGYMPIIMIGTSSIYNPGNDYRFTNRLYKCSRENYPTLFEDLYITGCHSILVPSMTDDQWEITKAINGNVFVTDNHFRLIACADEKAEPFNKEGFMNIYHIALEHPDTLMNYGIYANGLLVESCSERNLMELSNMRILGEEDNSVSQDANKVSNHMICQLVETY